MSDRTIDNQEVATAPEVGLERLIEVMRLVQEDCENDGMSLDGRPFTPRGVGEQFGNILAAVQAIARAVERLAKEQS